MGQITHGLSKHPLHNVWCGIINRCCRAHNPRYKDYGGRGISVCSEWRYNFVAFYRWGLFNGWKRGLTLDRIKNDGNYEPNNCQFISRELNTVKRRTLRKTNTSGYVGVHWDENKRKYRAKIMIGGRTMHLGRFDSPKLAAMVYDKAARHAGDSRSLNFG